MSDKATDRFTPGRNFFERIIPRRLRSPSDLDAPTRARLRRLEQETGRSGTWTRDDTINWSHGVPNDPPARSGIYEQSGGDYAGGLDYQFGDEVHERGRAHVRRSNSLMSGAPNSSNVSTTIGVRPRTPRPYEHVRQEQEETIDRGLNLGGRERRPYTQASETLRDDGGYFGRGREARAEYFANQNRREPSISSTIDLTSDAGRDGDRAESHDQHEGYEYRRRSRRDREYGRSEDYARDESYGGYGRYGRFDGHEGGVEYYYDPITGYVYYF